jgi:hypothetical protein
LSTNSATETTGIPKSIENLQNYIKMLYLLVISSAKTLGGPKNEILGALGHLLINP